MAEEQQEKKIENSVTIEKAGPCKKKIIIEIPAEAVKQAFDEQYDSLSKEALIPGFRKGRAPRRLLEKRFGKETSEQVKLKLLADSSDSAIKDNELDILREPDIKYEDIELPDEGAFKYDFEVEVRPEFKLPKLEGIPVERTKLQVTDEQIEREIEQLCKYSGVWTPREQGKVEADDQIIGDVLIATEGVEEEEKLDNTEIFVRPNGFIGQVPVEKLDELLAGAQAGQTKEITVEVPKTYFREQYRGKKVTIKIEIKEVKWLKPAELKDDLLKRFGVENKDELSERIQDSLQGRLEQQIRAQMSEQIYKYMLDNTDFDLPTDIVAEQAGTILQRQYVNLMQRGLEQEKIEQQMEQMRAGSEQQAKQQLKTFFIMDKIAEELGVEVTDEEVNGYIAQMAIQRGQRPERMKEQMGRDGSLSQFRLQVREDKCISKLLEQAKITEVEPKEKPKKAKSTKPKTKKTPEKKEESEKKPAKKLKKAAKKKTEK